MNITDLRIDNRFKPLGTGEKPWFSWRLESSVHGTLQTAYRLTVTDEEGALLMDSGTVPSAENCYIPYEGKPLPSRARCRVQVEVTDNHGNSAAAESFFETALLRPTDWQARWVCAGLPFQRRDKGFGKQAPATLFRRAFVLEKPVRRARVYATCHGVYRLTVNGRRPDDRELAPEYTAYEKYLCFQTYDVTALLQPGENALGMEVADGWYFSPELTTSLATLDQPHAVLFQVEVTFEDGSVERILSDERVICSTGPVVSSGLFAGEQYDARLEKPGWDEPGFVEEHWRPAVPTEDERSNLVPQWGRPVTVVRELPAVRTYTSPKGETIVDFGQNFAGRVRFTVDESAGQEVTVEVFEEPDRDGNYRDTILGGGANRGTEQRLVFRSAGRRQTWEPAFTYLGFRYARVTGLTCPEAAKFTGLALSTETENLSRFTCSDPALNQLISNVRWSQRSNMVSIPTDCPQREKGGWTADISLYARTALLQEDRTCFLTRWLDNARAEQGANGAIPMVVPYAVPYGDVIENAFHTPNDEIPAGIAGWSDAILFVPWVMYQITGNRLVLEENYDAMVRWCGYILRQLPKQGDDSLTPEQDAALWNTGFHYGEWLIPSTTREGTLSEPSLTAMRRSAHYTAPIFGWASMAYLGKIAGILEKPVDSAYYQQQADRMKAVIQEALILREGKPRWDYMGAYVLLLYFDLVPEEHRALIEEELVRRIHENGDRLDTGFLATPFLLPVLERIGRSELAYTLLFQQQEPSWLYEVAHGATTIWEAWTGFASDGNPLSISFNHYALGAVAEWIYAAVGGLEPDGPGFHHAVIRPRPDPRLTHASREYLSEQGWYRVRWQVENDAFQLEVEVPCNASATVVLPNGDRFEAGSGKAAYSCPFTPPPLP